MRREPAWFERPDWQTLSGAEKHRAFTEYGERAMQRSEEVMGEYRRKHQPELARVKRVLEIEGVALPPDFIITYEHPTNALGLQDLARMLRELAADHEARPIR